VADLEIFEKGPRRRNRPKIKGWRAKAGRSSWGGQRVPPHQLRGLGSAVSSPAALGWMPTNWSGFLQFQQSGWFFWTLKMKCFCDENEMFLWCQNNLNILISLQCILTIVISHDHLRGTRSAMANPGPLDPPLSTTTQPSYTQKLQLLVTCQRQGKTRQSVR